MSQVEYLGRFVNKETFRTNVYDRKGSKKLVESWDEYQSAIGSGVYFKTLEESKSNKESETSEPSKPKKPKKSRKKGDVLTV